MATKGERREAKQRKSRSHKTDGSSVRLLQRIVQERAEKARAVSQ